MAIITCVICGKPFKRKGSATTCSDKCFCENWDRRVKSKEYKERQRQYRERNREKLKERAKKYRQQPHVKKRINAAQKEYNKRPEVRERNLKYHREYYAKNREKMKKRMRECNKRRYDTDPDYRKRVNESSYGTLLWSNSIKKRESNDEFNYNSSFQTHHIFPVKLFPNFKFEDWNGCPIPKEWHRGPGSIHRLINLNDYSQEFMGIFIDFVLMKIGESKTGILSLDNWCYGLV
mgnify:CR=1 FL=1